MSGSTGGELLHAEGRFVQRPAQVSQQSGQFDRREKAPVFDIQEMRARKSKLAKVTLMRTLDSGMEERTKPRIESPVADIFYMPTAFLREDPPEEQWQQESEPDPSSPDAILDTSISTAIIMLGINGHQQDADHLDRLSRARIERGANPEDVAASVMAQVAIVDPELYDLLLKGQEDRVVAE